MWFLAGGSIEGWTFSLLAIDSASVLLWWFICAQSNKNNTCIALSVTLDLFAWGSGWGDKYRTRGEN